MEKFAYLDKWNRGKRSWGRLRWRLGRLERSLPWFGKPWGSWAWWWGRGRKLRRREWNEVKGERNGLAFFFKVLWNYKRYFRNLSENRIFYGFQAAGSRGTQHEGWRAWWGLLDASTLFSFWNYIQPLLLFLNSKIPSITLKPTPITPNTHQNHS